MCAENTMNELNCAIRLAELDARGDILDAVALCETLPCSEDVNCQRYLGWTYASRGELEKAGDWYLKAAAQGSSEAIDECWKCVLMIDARGNKVKAMSLCETSPLSEHLDCQRYLARTYFEKGDIDSTLRWCLKIVERGGSDDLLYVGKLYLSKNQPLQALDFLKRAALAGNAHSYQLLGEMYAFGLGVTKDIDLATRYYQEGAAKGYLLSQVRLLHIKRQQGGIVANLIFLLRFPPLALKALVIKIRNPSDPRLADIQRPR
jgi:TPR repeat protein